MSRCLALKVVVCCWVGSLSVVSAQYLPPQPAVIEIPMISEIASGIPATASVTISNQEQPGIATIDIAGGVIDVMTSPRFPEYLNGISKFELIPSTILARASYDQDSGTLSVRGTGLTQPLTISDVVNAISRRPQLSAPILFEAFGDTEVPLTSVPTASLSKIGRPAGFGDLFIESKQVGRASDFEMVFSEGEQVTAAPSAVYDPELRTIHVAVDGVVPTTLASIV